MENNLIIRRLDGDDENSRFYQGVTKEEGEILWTYPSVTHVLGSVYPMDDYLLKWIRTNGLSGQMEFEKAGKIGTQIHTVIESLLAGTPVRTEGLSFKVKKCVQSFLDWFEEYKPTIIDTEQIVVDHDLGVAGTRDFKCGLDYKELTPTGKVKNHYEGVYTIDWKSSMSIHEQHYIQNSQYWKADGCEGKTAIVHLGNRTKKKYSFLEHDQDEYVKKFKHFNETFKLMYPNAQPQKTEYPDVFTLKKES